MVINMFKLGKSSKRNLAGVDQRLIDILELALTKSRVDFGVPITGGVRTAEQQLELFRNGKSRADGYKNRSVHQSGRAVDIFAYVGGQASYKESDLRECARAIFAAAFELGYPIEWGGHWRTFVDMPHFQLTEV